MSVNEKMTALADAIREKSGVTGKLTIDGMTSAVKAISSLIVASASGNPIVLNDSTDLRVQSLRLFGKTTQNGTPTPEAPVPLLSAGDGGAISITISGENAQTQTLPVSTPNGLPGIPVTSGGNYTDETGRQWICDEVDFGRGVHVQRVGKTNTAELTDFVVADGYTVGESEFFYAFLKGQLVGTSAQYREGLCSKVPFTRSALKNDINGFYCLGSRVYCRIQGVSDPEVFNARIDGAEFLIPLDTVIEIPLSTEELAAYAALHTNYPNTTILNDGGAGMEVKYVADTKNYIDNQIAAVAAAIVNA